MNPAKLQPRQNERRLSFWRGSLRTRLLITSVALVVIPVLITGIVAALVSSQGLRNEVFGQLESVATLKDNQIHTWLESLQTNLNLVFANPASLDAISTYMANPSSEDVSLSQLRSDLTKYNQRSGYFTELFIMDLDGRVILSTNTAQEGKILRTQAFFQEGSTGPSITPPLYELSLKNYSIIVSQPLQNKFGSVIGVLAGRANLNTLNEIMSQRAGLGEQGETYVVNSNYAVLTKLRFEETAIGESYINTQGSVNAVEQQTNGSGIYEDYRGATVVGVYHWIPELQIAVMAEHNQEEALASLQRLSQIMLGLIVAMVVIAVLAAFFLTQTITSPISKLAHAAEEISRGNLEQNVQVTQQDEIGVLAASFNTMTSQLRGLIASLEQRVEERTKALTNVAEISTATSSIQNLEKMLETFVHLTQRRFGLYHAHVFLFDEKTESLNIIACGWKEGDEHEGTHGTASIPLHQEQSLVARAARTKNAVIVNDVHSDPGWLPNPLLPDTASEMAIPLLVGDEVLGVLDVQSDQINAFTESDANIQTTLASQVAISVQNAELYTRVETALQDTRLLMENAPEAIIIIDLATGLFADPNENAEKLYGLPYDELIKVGPAQMSPPKQPDGRDSVEKAMEKINEAVKGGRPVFDWIHRNAQGHDFPCEVRLVLIPGDHPRVRASVTDITERKRAEELTRQRAQYQETLNLISQRIQSTTSIEKALQVAARELGHVLGMKPTAVTLEAEAFSTGTSLKDSSGQ